MTVKDLPERPQQELTPPDGVRDIHRATNSSHSVILIGAGRRGLGAHVPALDACGHFRLAAIIDTRDRIAQLRDEPALTVPVYDCLDAVLAGPRPALAIVATPHDSHVPLAERLLRTGVPTLLEKPPARSAPELARLLKLSQEFRTPLATSLPLHYHPGYARFIRVLSDPDLTDAEVSIQATVTSWQGADRWRLSRERAGGGVLIDLGYHYLELIVACLGTPDKKLVRLRTAPGPGCEVEDEARVSLWFAERRLRLRLQLQSDPAAAKSSGLSVRRHGALVYRGSADGPADCTPGPERDNVPRQPTPAAAQLESLVTSGFLDGQGDWLPLLHRQQAVMTLLDDLYATAEYVTSGDRSANPARRPERTRT